MVDVEFLINVGGDLTGLQGAVVTVTLLSILTIGLEFPRKPPVIMKQHITDEANARLAFYLPLPTEQASIPGAPPSPELPENVVDTPLIRVYNFLRMVLFLVLG